MRMIRWAVLLGGFSLLGCASNKKPIEAVVDYEYRIGQEDVVEVMVFQSGDLSRTVPVRPDGKISLPLLGDIAAEGKTGTELSKELEEKLAGYIQTPHVTVIVREVNAPRVFVIGEVARPGAYPLRGRLDVIQALALAGGLGDFASKGGIVLIRKGPDGESRYSIDYNDLLRDEESALPLLRPGDTLYVP